MDFSFSDEQVLLRDCCLSLVLCDCPPSTSPFAWRLRAPGCDPGVPPTPCRRKWVQSVGCPEAGPPMWGSPMPASLFLPNSGGNRIGLNNIDFSFSTEGSLHPVRIRNGPDRVFLTRGRLR